MQFWLETVSELRHECENERGIYLIVVRAVRAFLCACILFLIADLNAHDRVHVEAGQLTGLDDCDAHLKVLRLQMVVEPVQMCFMLLRLLTRLVVALLTLFSFIVVLGVLLVIIFDVVVTRDN